MILFTSPAIYFTETCCLSLSKLFYFSYILGDATDTLFSVTAIGTSAGRIAVTGALDRETTSTYSINIKVKKMIVYYQPRCY